MRCVQQYVREEEGKEAPWSSGSNIVMWRRVVLALRVPHQGIQHQQSLLLDPQLLLQPRHSILLSTSQSIFCAEAGSIEKLDPNPPFAYYEILHIPRHANQSQVKHKVSSWIITCYKRRSRRHSTSSRRSTTQMWQGRVRWPKTTLQPSTWPILFWGDQFYDTLLYTLYILSNMFRDPSQRYHYDIHGVSLEEFQKK